MWFSVAKVLLVGVVIETAAGGLSTARSHERGVGHRCLGEVGGARVSRLACHQTVLPPLTLDHRVDLWTHYSQQEFFIKLLKNFISQSQNVGKSHTIDLLHLT